MSKTCSECAYLKLDSKDIYGKFFCESKLEWNKANADACSRFCNAYYRSNDDAKKAYKYSEEISSSNCYLTTMLCKILGLNDDNKYLNIIRNFRKNIMQNSEKYKAILVEYDIIGPKIADALYNDPLRNSISKFYFEKYILPITEAIVNKNNEKAINTYKDMTNTLKQIYSISNRNLSIDIINNADIKESGHGIYKVKKITS